MTTDLSGSAFSRADGTVQKRLIISIEGPEKSGKTHFALTAPPPIALIDFDTGLEGVIHKFHNKEVYVSEYRLGLSLTPDAYLPTWEKVKKDYGMALSSKSIRTIIVDTATELWELCRLRHFGKLDKIMPHHYSAPNAEYRELIRVAYNSNKNVILLHKVKSEYVNDRNTGKLIRAGFGDTGFLVQANLRTARDIENGFTVYIRDCRQNPDLAGMDLLGGMNDFPTLVSLVFGG